MTMFLEGYREIYPRVIDQTHLFPKGRDMIYEILVFIELDIIHLFLECQTRPTYVHRL